MIDLRKGVLPDCISVGGALYPVRTDFHYWINFSILARDERDASEYDFMYSDPERIPADRAAGFSELMKFAFPRNRLPRPVDMGRGDDVIYYDWETDGDLVYAAFYQQYGIDLLESRMHWHKFLALFNGLRETKMNDVMGFRGWMRPKGKFTDYDREQEKLREAWRIEPHYTKSEIEKIEKFESQLRD